MSALWNTYVAGRVLQSVMAMAGNGMTIACVIKSPLLRSPAHLLIASLALSDFLHGLTIAVIFPMKSFVTEWSLWRLSCLCLQGFESVTILAEFINIILLATERLVALRSKLGLNKWSFSKRFTGTLVCIIWIVIIVFVTCVIVTTEKLSPGLPCRMGLIFPRFYEILGLVLFLCATLLTLMLNAKIAKIAWDSQRRQHRRGGGGGDGGGVGGGASGQMSIRRKKELSVARMLAIVVGIFFLLCSPMYFATLIVKPTSPPWHRGLYYAFILLGDVNFWVNPVIYVWRNKDFRNAIRNLFGRHRQVVGMVLDEQEQSPGRKGLSFRTTVSVVQLQPTAKSSGDP